jgi:hypothetical protein
MYFLEAPSESIKIFKGVIFRQTQTLSYLSSQANKPTSQQAKPTSQQANKPTSQQANKPTSQQANKPTSQQANKPTENTVKPRRLKMSSLMPLAPPPKSPLGRYRLLSPTASIRVSPLCLGGMSFGDVWKEYS